MSENIKDLVMIHPNDHLETLKRCGGYYRCPTAPDARLGPLVGYAGKYKDASGAEKAYVGEVYYNFAMAEELPHVLDHYATCFAVKNMGLLLKGIDLDILLGAPMGGILTAGALGRALLRRVVFAEKKVTAVATKEKREESILVLDRHAISAGKKVAVVEDVCNNFSTTEKIISLVEKAGSQVVAIFCWLNRSSVTEYEIGETVMPVVSLLHIPTAQYRQDDPYVSSAIETGNVVWKPKDEWKRLEQAMRLNKIP